MAPGRVDRRDASAVVTAAVTVMTRMDTALDTSALDSQRRASWLMTPRLARQVQGGVERTGGGRWDKAGAHRAWSTSALTRSGQGRDSQGTPTLTGGCLDARVTWHSTDITGSTGSTDGWTQVDPVTTYCLTLSRADSSSAWAVANIAINDCASASTGAATTKTTSGGAP